MAFIVKLITAYSVEFQKIVIDNKTVIFKRFVAEKRMYRINIDNGNIAFLNLDFFVAVSNISMAFHETQNFYIAVPVESTFASCPAGNFIIMENQRNIFVFKIVRFKYTVVHTAPPQDSFICRQYFLLTLI